VGNVAASVNSFGAKGQLEVGDASYTIFRLAAVDGSATLPYSLKVLLENLLRTEDGANITAEHIRAIGNWDENADPDTEIQFTPARVVMQDFTGVPCVVDLATMREAVVALGGDPSKINPLAPAELVIDHSVQIDVFGNAGRLREERRVGVHPQPRALPVPALGADGVRGVQGCPAGHRHRPPGQHRAPGPHRHGPATAWPTPTPAWALTRTRRWSTAWVSWAGGVGGIEAEAAMLGQPVSMLIPRVVGFKLTGATTPGVTATDVVLTITDMLRKHGVVGKFVEFYGEGVGTIPLANRATIANMSPEFGSTCAIFPIDDKTIDYLRLTGRADDAVALVEAYAKDQGLWLDPAAEPRFSEKLELDLSTVVPSIAGPKRPQDRIELSSAKAAFATSLPTYTSDPGKRVPVQMADGRSFELFNGAVSIASITSCTNTSNPSVMIAAGLVARKAAAKGLARKPWVKTSMAPGSKVVTGYYEAAGLWPDLEAIGFYLVGYGCATCIGNSGPLEPEISEAINANDLAVTAVLSGNRNFEGRISPDVKMNYLASPPLVIAYALAGTMDFDFETDSLGTDQDGNPVYLRDIWPSPEEIQSLMDSSIKKELFTKEYADVFAGDSRWQSLQTPVGKTFEWDGESTYVRKPPYFEGMALEPSPVADIAGARVLAFLGDSVTTDHISPAGSIKVDSPAGKYLAAHGVERKDFNSYGSRRGNHEVMIRGTFANIRLKNLLLDGVEGGFTRDFLDGGAQTTIYDASAAYQAAGVPLVVLAGKEYGSGSSRDWAAKGTRLLGVKAVIAESYERIHRSNLIGMGVLPLQFPAGENAASLGLDGTETFDISGVTELNDGVTPRTLRVTATKPSGDVVAFDAPLRIDTPGERDYYRNDGILQYVLRSLVS
jgi:aconitate hydratase